MKTPRGIWSIIILLIIALNGFSSEIRGRITDKQTGEPLPGAYVYLEKTGFYATSDPEGKFRITNVPAGTYHLAVWMLSYNEYRTTVRLADGEIKEMAIALAQAPLRSDEIVVTSTPDQVIPEATIFAQAFENENVPDVGKYLRSQPGFSAIRKGGFAMDPVFRGFMYEQLNIQYDNGIRSSNACPNRMDPPSAHIQAEELEKIEVIKGPFAVRYGPVMGGLVNLVTRRPEEGDTGIHFQAETGYESNGGGKTSSLSVKGKHSRMDYYLGVTRKVYGDYVDGAGNTVPSSFNLTDYGIKIGFVPITDHRIQVSFHNSLEKDVNFPALPMDSREVDNRIMAVDYSARNLTSWLVGISAKAYGTYNYHYMTNEGRPNFAMTHAYAPVYSETRGGKVELKLAPASHNIVYVGADYYWLHKWGDRQRVVYRNGCTGMIVDPPKTFYDKIWQNSQQRDVGIFAEWRWLVSPVWTVISGVRNDFVESSIGDPALQFQQLYGNAQNFTASNFSANASIRYEGLTNTTLHLSIGRGVRSPNLTEMFINHLTVGMDPFEYVGNPHLKSEINNQIELGIRTRLGSTQVQGNVYYSYLQNYISAAIDSAIPRLFMPCQEPKVSKRFMNLDRAYKYGVEVHVTGQLTNTLGYAMGVAYTYGQNLDFDEPLPFVPPLEGLVKLRYQQAAGNWWGEVSTRMVAPNTRYAASAGEGRAPGFTVINILAGWKVHKYVEIYGGVYNVLNRDYFEYLNRPYKNMPVSGVITEPGRSFVFNLRLRI